MLVLPVPVIREEKSAATPALTSLRLWAHRAPKAPQPREESKYNRRTEEQPKGRSKKSFQEKSRKKKPGKKKGISNRRFSGNIIPPLTILGAKPVLPVADPLCDHRAPVRSVGDVPGFLQTLPK
jgi:hypothetical protein